MYKEIKETVALEWHTFMQAPIISMAALILIILATWFILKGLYKIIIDSKDAEISLLEQKVNELQTRTISPETDTLSSSANLTLHFYGDTRTPTMTAYDNIWRWFSLKNIISNQEGQSISLFFELFINFDKPVRVGTIEISSPNFVLPLYEVKEFNNRFAIIVFSGDIPVGDIFIHIH